MESPVATKKKERPPHVGDNIVEFDPETYFTTISRFLDSLQNGMPGDSPSPAAVASQYESLVGECASSPGDVQGGRQ